MPDISTLIDVGSRVSYEDMANPRQFGVVVAYSPELGGQYAISWDGESEVIWSDCRQAGWRKMQSCENCGRHEFFYVPGRDYPTFCLDCAEDAKRGILAESSAGREP